MVYVKLITTYYSEKMHPLKLPKETDKLEILFLLLLRPRANLSKSNLIHLTYLF